MTNHRAVLFVICLILCVQGAAGQITTDRFMPVRERGVHTRRPERVAVDFWLTDPDKSTLFKRQPAGLVVGCARTNEPTIEVDETRTFQTIDGFGYCLTGGSAMLLMQMSPAKRAALLRELFATNQCNIGTSYLRVSIGASDLNSRIFSYDDLPWGLSDPEMALFSLQDDLNDVIPVLREIMAICPELKIMGSPWSAPTWMKTINDTRGGALRPECYEVYAKYFVKYIQGMRREGIRIDAITVQNEPLNPANNPSMVMSASEQASFIKGYLGPAFNAAQIDTKIILYDHNADRPDYPISILDDPEARKYVDGSAFHLYGGQIEALSKVHEAHPDKNLYFSEQWVGAPGNLKRDLNAHVKYLIIGASRNWSRTVLEWNLAADATQDPHTDRGGCDRCLGALTITGNHVTRNPAYYIIAHAAKFVRPGSVRIASNELKSLPNVAFQRPDGRKVLIVLNEGGSLQNFNIRCHGKEFSSSLSAGAVGTFVW